MERKYREITLRRIRLRRRIILGAIGAILLFWIGSVLPDSFWSMALNRAAGWFAPSAVSYLNRKEKRKAAPLWLELTAPPVFGFTWEEDETEIQIAEEEPENKEIHISVPEDSELSLLMENLYEGEYTDPSVSMENPLYIELTDSIDSKQVDKQQFFNLSSYQELEDLIKDFYIVDESTRADSSLINIENLTSFDCTIDKNAEGPQILIYHSHSQEDFADSVPGDESTTIVGAGEKLARLLEEEYGYQVLHHTGVYDKPSRDEAYSNALPAIEQVLEENPTIQVVIDLHRDAVPENTKLVTTIDGKDYARFMFFNGLCRTTSGPISYLYNPYLQENLAFSFQAEVIAESYFPGITRKIYLKAWRYNMHLRARNMLIELGAQTNTVEEVMNTCDILAFVLDSVLSGNAATAQP